MQGVGCVLCGNNQQLFRCARCRSVLYCSKEHQKLHWRIHKPMCFQVNPEAGMSPLSSPNFSAQPTEMQGRYVINDAYARGGASQSGAASQMYQQDAWGQTGWPKEQNVQAQPNPSSFLNIQESELISAIDTIFGDSSGQNSMPHREERRAYDPNCFMNSPSTAVPPLPFVDSFQHCIDMRRNTAEWMLQVCQYVIRDLDKYGICVIDNFLGKEHGEAILQTTEDMYDSGVFRDGEVVSNKWRQPTRTIRGDQITWVDGTEPGAQSVAYLISMVDSVIMHAKRLKNNGSLGNHVIQGRTKAMVACYPGSGTHYVKHIDNPNRDGRCVTTIYYLNKNWNCKEDGGLLRIFPTGWSSQVADIEPLFDRMLFFWSDRRNPHEVQPAFRTRYAITLWYFDAKEREEARLQYQRETAAARMNQSLPQPMNLG